MSNDSIQFDATFDTVTHKQWRDHAESSLRGATYEQKLVSHTLDGLEIHPLYREDDIDGERVSQYPATPPYTRGSAATPGEQTWEIRQEFRQPDPRVSNKQLLVDLERGVSGIRIIPDSGFSTGGDNDTTEGVVLRVEQDAQLLFGGVHLQMIGTAIRGGANGLGALALLDAAARSQDLDLNDIRGTVGYDPLGQLAEDGQLSYNLDTAMDIGAALAQWTRDNAPHIRPIEVSATIWHEAGASEGREIAYALATGLQYLRGLTARGVSVDDAANSMGFYVASGRDTFIEIAKLRALRKAWARIVEQSGGSEDAQRISMHARSSKMTFSQRDPWVNMLRSTSQTFSAAVGGAESMTVGTFDEVIGHSDRFSRRIARNTQLVLRDESHIGRTSDPAGGSYYLEHLTQTLADRSWSIFQKIESDGGLADYLTEGKSAADLESIMHERDQQIANRSMPITGVSEFPNLDEEAVTRETPEPVSPEPATGNAPKTAEAFSENPASAAVVEACLEDFANGSSTTDIFNVITHDSQPTKAPVAQAERYPALWEALRDASDASDERPQCFLANIGDIPQHRARATFAQNLLQAAGIRTRNNDGFPDVNAAIEAFHDSDADIACICSTGDIYNDVIETLAPALKQAGAQEVYVAGRGGDNTDTWTSAGVDHVIYKGSNVLATLTETLTTLGVIEDA